MPILVPPLPSGWTHRGSGYRSGATGSNRICRPSPTIENQVTDGWVYAPHVRATREAPHRPLWYPELIHRRWLCEAVMSPDLRSSARRW